MGYLGVSIFANRKECHGQCFVQEWTFVYVTLKASSLGGPYGTSSQIPDLWASKLYKNLQLTFVTKHPFPSVVAVALEGQGAVAVLAAGQAEAFGAVGPSPAHLTGAGVGPGAVALTVFARGYADGIPAVVHLIGVAGQASHVAVPVADVVVVFLELECSVSRKCWQSVYLQHAYRILT